MADQLSPFENDNATHEARDAAQQGNDRRDDRRDERHQWQEPGAWIGGAILIVLGLIFLAQNLGFDVPVLRNWWAVFILIPAIRSLSETVVRYRSSGGRLTGAVIGSLIGGVALAMVALTFLMGWRWVVVGPVLLILAGIGALLSALAAR